MSHKHHSEESVEDLLKKLIVLTCDLFEQGQVQILQNRHIVQLLSVIAAEDAPPYLATIQLLSKGISMNSGPITLVTAGETDQTVLVGTDQFGNPWTAEFPSAEYSADDPAVVSVDSTGLVTADADGTTNVNASLTNSKGDVLTASLQYVVAIPVEVPVLTSISLQSNHA